MELKRIRQLSAPERRDKIKFIDSVSRVRRSKLNNKVLSSITLMLNIYNLNDNHVSGESLIDNSLNRIRIRLKNALAAVDKKSLSYEKQLVVEVERPHESSLLIGAIRSWYPVFVTRYIHDCHRMNNNSLCKKLTRIEESQILYVGQSMSSSKLRRTFPLDNRPIIDLLNFTRALQDLAEQLNRQPQRSSSCSVASETSTEIRSVICNERSSIALQTDTRRCDRGVQCPLNSEFLTVSSDLKFFSRSSLVINLDRPTKTRSHGSVPSRGQTPSLEYVANYKPEQKIGKSKARSASSTALVNVRRNSSSASITSKSSSAESKSFNNNAQHSNEVDRKGNSRAKGRSEDEEEELLRFSSFIEDDLSRFCYESKPGSIRNNEDRCSVAAKKILLEDYITEVKEIVRSGPREAAGESRILASVKRRMDEDVVRKNLSSVSTNRTGRTDSWHSLGANRTRSTLVTACGTKSACRCREANRRNLSIQRQSLVPTKLCSFCALDRQITCLRRRIEALKRTAIARTDKDTVCCLARKRKKEETSGEKSSTDSGVLMDMSGRSSGSCQSSNETGSSSLNFRIVEDEASSGSMNDEVLGQRVERAVRRFTEKLILCERRTKERSKTRRLRRDRQWTITPRRDRRIYSLFKYLKRSRCSSEEDCIAEISTPSLVSLSDTDNVSSSEVTR